MPRLLLLLSSLALAAITTFACNREEPASEFAAVTSSSSTCQEALGLPAGTAILVWTGVAGIDPDGFEYAFDSGQITIATAEAGTADWMNRGVIGSLEALVGMGIGEQDRICIARPTCDAFAGWIRTARTVRQAANPGAPTEDDEKSGAWAFATRIINSAARPPQVHSWTWESAAGKWCSTPRMVNCASANFLGNAPAADAACRCRQVSGYPAEHHNWASGAHSVCLDTSLTTCFFGSGYNCTFPTRARANGSSPDYPTLLNVTTDVVGHVHDMCCALGYTAGAAAAIKAKCMLSDDDMKTLPWANFGVNSQFHWAAAGCGVGNPMAQQPNHTTADITGYTPAQNQAVAAIWNNMCSSAWDFAVNYNTTPSAGLGAQMEIDSTIRVGPAAVFDGPGNLGFDCTSKCFQGQNIQEDGQFMGNSERAVAVYNSMKAMGFCPDLGNGVADARRFFARDCESGRICFIPDMDIGDHLKCGECPGVMGNIQYCLPDADDCEE